MYQIASGAMYATSRVNFVGLVRAALMAAAANIISAAGTSADAVRRLDLNFEQAAGDINDEVVAVTVSPRLGDAEAHGGGFGQEGGFSDLATTFGLILDGLFL